MIRAIFDPPYTYDYLARPDRIVPNTAAAMPEISADALVARARETGRFDYDAPLPGLQAIDRYTIRIRLTAPSYDLLADLTTAAAAAVARLAGKKLPLAGRVEINIIEESNPRLLTFNMDDPIVGGYARERVALRRAIAMAYNTEDDIRVIRQGQAVPATQPVPPGVTGHDPNFDGHVTYDPAGARALLDKFGYVDRDRDGSRDLPDGRPFTLKIASTVGAVERQFDELWQRSLEAIGIRVEHPWPYLDVDTSRKRAAVQ